MPGTRQRFIGVIAGTLGLLFAFTVLSAGSNPNGDSPTTLILVRHAEKTADGTADPGLTRAGRQRAEQLAYVLKHMDLSAIYATPYRRTRQTAAPTASSRNMPILSYAADEEEFAGKAAADFAGGMVLIVGHSNTIPRLINRLIGADAYAQLPEHVYDNLFIVTIGTNGRASVVRLRFGDRTPEE